MNHGLIVRISVLIALVLGGAVTALVSARVRRSPARAEWEVSGNEPVFIVRCRPWQPRIIRTVGIAAAVVGALFVLVSQTTSGSTLGMGVAGIVIMVGGLVFVWLAHSMVRMRLKVSPDSAWVLPALGAPRRVHFDEITRLTPMRGNSYGGTVAWAGRRRLFQAQQLMLGYPELIRQLRIARPDLFRVLEQPRHTHADGPLDDV